MSVAEYLPHRDDPTSLRDVLEYGPKSPRPTLSPSTEEWGYKWGVFLLHPSSKNGDWMIIV